jgi:antitoxin component YwqK of YwqJK toxin-antitoxin module
MKTFLFSIFLFGSSLLFSQEPMRYDYYNSNIKKSKGLMRVSKNGELLTGIVFGKYNNGQLEFEESYVNGKKEGEHKYYNKKGMPTLVILYENDNESSLHRIKYKNDKVMQEIYLSGRGKERMKTIYNYLWLPNSTEPQIYERFFIGGKEMEVHTGTRG